MADVFREVDEDLAEEDRRKFFTKWAPYGAALALAVIAVVGGREYWSHQQNTAASQSASAYAAAIDIARQDPSAGRAALQQVADESAPGYAALALLHGAALAEEAGDITAAIEAYQALSTDASTSRHLRDLAAIRLGYTLLGAGRESAASGAVSPLLTRETAFRPFAQEIIGVVAYRSGDYSTARDAFTGIIANPDAPPILREQTAPELLELVNAATTAAPASPPAVAPAAPASEQPAPDAVAPQPEPSETPDPAEEGETQ